MTHRHVTYVASWLSVLTLSMTIPTYGASPEPKPSKQSERTSREGAGATIPRPDDCSQIKEGTPDGTSQAAARKDCERSKHLGGGTGTSSGTGSGKQPSGSGSR